VSPEQLVAVLAGFTALLVAAGAILRQLLELRREVDGRLTQLLNLTRTSSVALGDLQGRAAAATEAADLGVTPIRTKFPE